MASQNAEGKEPRPPTIDDLVGICKGIRIPIADIFTMIQTKQGIRPRDKEDLLFLMSIVEEGKDDM